MWGSEDNLSESILPLHLLDPRVPLPTRAFSLALKLDSKLQMFRSLFALLLFPVKSLSVFWTGARHPHITRRNLKGPHRGETVTTAASGPNGALTFCC